MRKATTTAKTTTAKTTAAKTTAAKTTTAKTTTAQASGAATWGRTLLRVTPVFAAAALVLAACGGGEKKTVFHDISGIKIQTVTGKGDSGTPAPTVTSTPVPDKSDAPKLPTGLNIAAEAAADQPTKPIAKAGDVIKPIPLQAGKSITITDENARLGDASKPSEQPKSKLFDVSGKPVPAADATVKIEGDNKKKAISIQLLNDEVQWLRAEISFPGILLSPSPLAFVPQQSAAGKSPAAGKKPYTLILENPSAKPQRGACAPAVPSVGDKVVVDYTYVADTELESPSGEPNKNGTIYPNGKTTATLNFKAGQSAASALSLSVQDSNPAVAFYHPQSANINPGTGRITDFVTANVTAKQALVGFGFVNPPVKTDMGPDWRSIIAAQDVQPGQAIQPIQVNMLAKGKIPKLLDALYGPGLVKDDNTIVVTMNVTGKRLPDQTLTIDGKQLNTCHYQFKMRRVKHTIHGSNAEKMNKFGGAEFESDGIGEFMPQLDGEFWSSNQIPWTVAQAKYHHVTGIGADATKNDGKDANGSHTFEGMVIDPLNPTGKTQQGSESFVVKSFTSKAGASANTPTDTN